MDAHEVKCARVKLALCVADVFASIPRKDQRAKSDCCLRGLMMDGRRKSIQAMASRLPDGFTDRRSSDACSELRRFIDYMFVTMGSGRRCNSTLWPRPPDCC